MTFGRPIPEIVVLFSALLFTSRIVSADFSLDALMFEFSQISASQAKFKEQRTLSVLESPLILTGTLTYRAPDYLKKEITQPYHSSFEIHGDHLLIETEEEQTVFALDSHPLLRAFAESFRATLSGNLTTLKRYYRVDFDGIFSKWTLVLTPKQTEVLTRIERIVLTGNGTHIQSVQIIETSGDTSTTIIAPDDS